MDTAGLNEMVSTPASAPRGNPVLLLELSRRWALIDVGAIVLCLAVQSAVLTAWYVSFAPWHTPEARIKGWMTALTVANGAVLGLAAVLTWVAGLRADTLGVRRDDPERQVLWGIGGAVVTWFALFGWRYVAAFVGRMLVTFSPRLWLWERTSPHPYADALGLLGLPTTLGLMVIPALGEEVLFRSLLLPRLRRLTGHWWSAVLLCSIAFAWYHRAGGFSAVASTFVMSLVFCVTFIRSRSLLAAFLAHFVYNATVAWFAQGS